MNGLYDILESYREEERLQGPRFTYDGLYQDPPRKDTAYGIYGRGPIKQYPYGLGSTDLNDQAFLQSSFPLDIRGINTVSLFDPRVGRPEQSLSYNEPYFINAPQDFYQLIGDPFQTDYPITRATQEENEDVSRDDGITRDDGIMSLDLEQKAIGPFAEGTLKQPTGIKDIFEKIRSFSPVGMLQNLFNTSGPNYQLYSPGTRIRNGIVSINGVNTPYNAFGGDFFNPATGLNRFDRAALRGDIFGSSRTLKEYLDKKRQISDARKIANTPGDNNPDGSGGYTGGFDSSTGNYNDPYSSDTE